MRPIRLATLCVALGLAAVFNSNSYAQIASDNAGNYSGGWTNGANGGTGFGAWGITASGGTGGAGVFIGDPSSGGISGLGSQAFGFYANPTNSGAFVNANRSFSAGGLTNGQTFSLKWGINWDSGSGGNKGFNLFAGGTGGSQLININNGGSQDITFNGVNVNFGYGTAAMTWTFTQVNANLLRVTANDRDGIGTFTTNVVVAGRVDSFRIYASAMQAGDAAQPYFNDFAVTAASTTDADTDGMPDWWELGYFGDTTSQVGNGDADNDGLNNQAEFNAGTIPNVADTDGDGLKDGFEAGTSGYQVVLGSFHWDTARLHAIARGGNLATITSAAEKTTIASQVTEAEMNELWLGGYKSGANWAWVTGETWNDGVYNNWMPNEPGATDGQNYLRLKTFNEGWDNWFATPTFSEFPVTIRGYLLEKSQTTDPTKFNHPLITVAGDFQDWKAEPTPTAAPVNVMNPGTGANQFVRTLDYRFPVTARFTGKFANGEVFTSSNNINWGTSATAGVAQRNGFGNDIPFNVTSTGWWTFTFNTDTLSYDFTRKTFSSYLEYAAAYDLPADGSGGGQTEDYEGDGLTNAQEFSANTNPTSSDTDEDQVPDVYEINTSTTSALLADTDSDTLPDWWELNVGLDAKSASGDNGATGNPDGDLFTNKQEFDGQSDPKLASSVPANRAVTFTLDLNRQISSGAFLTNSHTVEVWGTFNDWGNLTNSKFTLTNNGSGFYTGTHTLPGAQGSTNRYKYVTFPSSNNAVWEDGNDRPLVMGADGVATNLPTAYLGEVRPVTFSVNMGVQATLGRFTHGTHKVYVAGDVVGSWNAPGTELVRVGGSDVYSAVVFVSGTNNATANFKFYANNALGFEADLDAATTGDQTRVLTLGARDTAQTNAEVYFNNVTNVPANRTVTFAVNMNVQTNTNKLSFNPVTDFVEVRGDFNFFGGGTDWRLTNNGTGIYTRSFVLVGNEGVTNAYKYVAVIVTATNTNSVWERVDIPRTNVGANRTFVLGATNTNQVVHSVAFPALFSDDDGAGPTGMSVFPASIAENNSLGATVGALSSTGDTTAGDTHTYSLVAGVGDTDNSSFSITGSDLKIGVVANYEDKTNYSVRVRSTDAYGNSFEDTLTINITDVAEGSTFASWRGANAATPVLLTQYAFGAFSPSNAVNRSNLPTGGVNGSNLVLTYHVRADANNANLVVPQLSGNLADTNSWNTNGITHSEVATNTVDGVSVVRKTASVPIDSTNRKFLRLKIAE